MFKQLVIALAAASFLVAGCSTHTAHLNMSDFKSEMDIKTGSWDGQEVGYVSGSQGGAVWSECTPNANSAVREMISNAKSKGANAIGNIKWAAKESAEPSCKKGWGWVLLWPFLLTPVFMSSHVEGMGYKVNEATAKKTGLLMLPTTEMEEAAFIETVMAM